MSCSKVVGTKDWLEYHSERNEWTLRWEDLRAFSSLGSGIEAVEHPTERDTYIVVKLQDPKKAEHLETRKSKPLMAS